MPNALVDFSISGGDITEINGQAVSTPPYHGFTDESTGDVTVLITRDSAGCARLVGSVGRPCGQGSSSNTKEVWFGDVTPVVFCIDCTTSTWDGDTIKQGVCDTVDYLNTNSTCLFGGVKFADSGIITYESGELTTDAQSFKNWVNRSWGGGNTEHPYEAVKMAKDMAPGAQTFIALATDEASNESSGYRTMVTAEVVQAGCKVFVDPGQERDPMTFVWLIDYQGIDGYYHDLAANGAVEQEAGNLGTFQFLHMRQTITGLP